MKQKRLIIILDIALILLVLCSGWIAALMLRLLPDCFVTELGLQCPACGGTRCIRAIASGDFVGAFAYNPYLFGTGLLAGLLLILLNLGYVCGFPRCKNLLQRINLPWLVILWAIGFVLFGIARNLF